MAEREQDEQYGLDEQLLRQLGPDVSGGMPVGQPTALDAPAAPQPRRGTFNNLMLDMPAQRGASSGARWEGYNTDRASAGGDPKSVKDAFYRFGQSLDFDPTNKSKEDAQAYMLSQRENAKNYGLDILDANRDQILVRTAEAPEGQWIDWIRNSGGGADQAFQWAPMTGPGSGDGSPMGGGMGAGSVDDLINADLSGILSQAAALTENGDIDPALLQQMLGQEMR